MATKDTKRVTLTRSEEMEAVFQVGLPVLVQAQGDAHRHWARLAGWLAGEAVILALPPAEQQDLGQAGAGPTLVRFFSLGGFYGFQSPGLAAVESPRLAVLAWPQGLERVPLSSEKRYALRIPMQMTMLGRGREESWPWEAQLGDISLGGCQARLPRGQAEEQALVKGVVLRLAVSLEDEAQDLVVKAQVRNLQCTDRELLLGLRFENGQDQALGRLQLALAPQLLLGGSAETPEDADPEPEAPPPPPLAEPAPLAMPPLDTEPLLPIQAPPSAKTGQRKRKASGPGKVDTTATRVRLEDISAERAASILEVSDLGGSLAAIIQARETVRAWVEKYGENSVRERAGLLRRECARIEGLLLIR